MWISEIIIGRYLVYGVIHLFRVRLGSAYPASDASQIRSPFPTKQPGGMLEAASGDAQAQTFDF